MAKKTATTQDMPRMETLVDRWLDIYDDLESAGDWDIIAQGQHWYTDSRRMIARMAKDAGITKTRAAAIFAVYSTNNTWKGNVTMATNACAGNPRGMRTVLAKVHRILAGERPHDVVTSDKLRNFYRNLAGDLSCVTVDRWMARASGTDNGSQPEGERYAYLAESIALAAEQRGYLPADFQAILWCAIRGTGA